MADQPKEQPTKDKAEIFVEKYQELCEEYGYQLQVTPAWKARDDGTFSLIQQVSVGELPKENK